MTLAAQNADPIADWRRPALLGGLVLAVTFGGFFGWAALAPLDSAVVAGGHVAVQGDRKVVQHAEGGLVAEILVKPDSFVHSGDVLLRIDPVEANAGLGILVTQKATLQAEEARLVAETGDGTVVAFPEGLPASIVADEQRRFDEGVASRANKVGILDAQNQQTLQQIAGYREQIAGNDEQIKSLADELARIAPGIKDQIIPAKRGTDIERQLTDLRTRGATLASEITRLEGIIAETAIQVAQVQQDMLEKSTARLVEVRASLSEIAERESVASAVALRSEVRAPVSGKVVGLTVATVGQVVKPGETVLEIVPDDGVLQISARMSPLDVTHVHPGLVAEIRLPSFKRNETPMTLGEVVSVSADAMLDQTTRQSYYELKVSMDVDGFPADVRDALVAGMPAEVVVATGERTMLAYLTQPLTDAMRTGMRER